MLRACQQAKILITGLGTVELPMGHEIPRELLPGQAGTDHFNRDAVLLENGVVKSTVGHLAAVHKLVMQGAKL